MKRQLNDYNQLTWKKPARDMVIAKPYYFEDNGNAQTFGDVESFLKASADNDPDLNLVVRFDFNVSEADRDSPEDLEYYGPPGTIYCEIGYVLQRKGFSYTERILNVSEEDIPRLIDFLKPRWELMRHLWAPVSGYIPKTPAETFAMDVRQIAKKTATNTLIDMEGIDEYERGRHQLVAHSTATAILDLIDGNGRGPGYELIPRKAHAQPRMPDSISGNLAELFAQINS